MVGWVAAPRSIGVGSAVFGSQLGTGCHISFVFVGAIEVRKSFQAARTGLSGRTRLAPSHALCAAQFSA